MQILSHRGYWNQQIRANSFASFEHSFGKGFGLETDLRDQNGEIVISHDFAQGKCLHVRELFEAYLRYSGNQNHLTLALNIKADGLAAPLKKLLLEYRIEHYFVFDAAVPDLLQQHRQGLKFFTRQSDIEHEACLYAEAQGIWLDGFFKDEINVDRIGAHVQAGKKVCLVSPELHKRSHLGIWQEYRELARKMPNAPLMLCTDFPEEAREFFYADKN